MCFGQLELTYANFNWRICQMNSFEIKTFKFIIYKLHTKKLGENNLL